MGSQIGQVTVFLGFWLFEFLFLSWQFNSQPLNQNLIGANSRIIVVQQVVPCGSSLATMIGNGNITGLDTNIQVHPIYTSRVLGYVALHYANFLVL